MGSLQHLDGELLHTQLRELAMNNLPTYHTMPEGCPPCHPQANRKCTIFQVQSKLISNIVAKQAMYEVIVCWRSNIMMHAPQFSFRIGISPFKAR